PIVESREHLEEHLPETPPFGTLGDVLYAKKGQRLVPEAEWAGLVHAVAAGNQAALHGLYERTHRLVFTLAVRLTGHRETAEEVTLDVFHEVWRRAPGYDPVNGTVLGWVMNIARSRAIDRVRFEQRQKRRALEAALCVLAPEERQAIEAAFLSGLTHSEVAVLLEQPLGTVKTRIRSGLQKLRQAMGAG